MIHRRSSNSTNRKPVRRPTAVSENDDDLEHDMLLVLPSDPSKSLTATTTNTETTTTTKTKEKNKKMMKDHQRFQRRRLGGGGNTLLPTIKTPPSPTNTWCYWYCRCWSWVLPILLDVTLILFIHWFAIQPYITNRLMIRNSSLKILPQGRKQYQYLTSSLSSSMKLTPAARKEQSLHHRILVHAMYVTQKYLKHQIYPRRPNDIRVHTSRHAAASAADHSDGQEQVFVGLFVNPTRAIPYVNAFIVSYLWNLHKDTYNDTAEATATLFYDWMNHSHKYPQEESLLQIHVVDTHRLTTSKTSTNNITSYYVNRMDSFRFIILHLPFLTYHLPSYFGHDTDSSSSSSSSSSSEKQQHQHKQQRESFNTRCHTIEYYTKAIQACMESSLSYCILVQESTVLPTYFTFMIRDWILQDATQNITSLWNLEIISLFSMIQTSTSSSSSSSSMNNTIHGNTHRVLNVQQEEYSSSLLYKYDTALLNSQRKELHILPYQPKFTIYTSLWDNTDPTPIKARNVALWIPRIQVVQHVLPFLIHSQSLSCNNNKNNNMNQQIWDFEYELALYTKKKVRYHVEPSLINHIGGLDDDEYEDIYSNNNNHQEDSLIQQQESIMITDPRFILDPGLYQQGLDFYCKDESDGEWYMYDEPVNCLDTTRATATTPSPPITTMSL